MRLLGHAMARPGVGVVTSHELAAVQLLQLYPYPPVPVPTPTPTPTPTSSLTPTSTPTPIPTPNLIQAARSRPLGLVHFAHTDLSGLSLFEEAVHWGGRAAAEVALALPSVTV